VVVRDQYPEQFGAVHDALFAARHDNGLDIRDNAVVAGILDAAGVPGDKVLAEVEAGEPINEIERAYLLAVDKWSIFGVPTFVVDDRAVFVRLMSRPQGDAALARRTIEGIVRLMDEQPDLNEFKYTTLDR
jgi:2-hydroxychromene-2-carboxylate isomerase